MSAGQQRVLRAVASYCIPAYLGTEDHIFVRVRALRRDVKISRTMLTYYGKQLQMRGLIECRKGPGSGYRLTEQGIRTMGWF